MELDHDEPPDGQHQGVPDRYCVDKDGEVSMKQEENSPVVRKLKGKYFLRIKKLNLTFSSMVLDEPWSRYMWMAKGM